MFKFTRTVLNNINKTKYLKNINNVNVREITVDDSGNNPVTKEGDLSNIKILEEDIRLNNLEIFYKYYLIARVKRFFIVSMPAMLSALTIGSFVLPTYHEETKNIKMYNVKTTTLSNDLGQSETEEKYYEAAFDKNLIDYPDMENISSYSDELNFRISDGTDSIVAKFDIDTDGTLKFKSAGLENVLDLSGYEDLDYSDMNEKYVTLFDDIINILNNRNYLSNKEIEELNRLTELDKVEIIAEIVEKEYIGKESVLVNSSRIGCRVFLIFVTIIYGIVEMLILLDGGYDENESITVDKDGCIREDSNSSSEFGLMYGPMKYRELFMKAERNRIKAIATEICKNVVDIDENKIFTRFEKKLLKKY